MLSTYLVNENFLVTILSGDKDILQLITNRIRVAFLKQNSFFEIYNREKVREEMGGL